MKGIIEMKEYFDKFINALSNQFIECRHEIFETVKSIRTIKDLMLFDFPTVTDKGNLTIKLSRELTESEQTRFANCIPTNESGIKYRYKPNNDNTYFNGKLCNHRIEFIVKDVKAIDDLYNSVEFPDTIARDLDDSMNQ